MDPIAILILFFIYAMIGNYIGNSYFGRRHGIRGRLGRGLQALDVGIFGAAFVSMTWPVSVWLPQVKDPSLCSHPHHVLARG